jgi:hypothetical protein
MDSKKMPRGDIATMNLSKSENVFFAMFTSIAT